jgi:hypothetical protein
MKPKPASFRKEILLIVMGLFVAIVALSSSLGFEASAHSKLPTSMREEMSFLNSK